MSGCHLPIEFECKKRIKVSGSEFDYILGKEMSVTTFLDDGSLKVGDPVEIYYGSKFQENDCAMSVVRYVYKIVNEVALYQNEDLSMIFLVPIKSMCDHQQN